ncbi:hypothetical protein RJ640_003702 [Escallonia rubra]|uniref:Ribosomal protein L34Ae n=1 Tax=Escallonia rubra TaxID=112253 RepID=A0AA88RF34_9ASTE|nr:hypothetical protein RJ640_003702 [Escallonia rubra]
MKVDPTISSTGNNAEVTTCSAKANNASMMAYAARYRTTFEGLVPQRSSVLTTVVYGADSLMMAICNRNQDEFEFGVFSEEEEEEEEETDCYYVEGSEKDHLVADIIHGGEGLSFLPSRSTHNDYVAKGKVNPEEPITEESVENFGTEQYLSVYSSTASGSEAGWEDQEEGVGDKDLESANNSDATDDEFSSPMMMDVKSNCNGQYDNRKTENEKIDPSVFSKDENFLSFAPTKLETKMLQVQEKDNEEVFGDSCTVGSTSKSSSEWRSSINYRDSGTEDPFSSSSRRSCPKWESYTVFQKYDEEMLFLDRISAQKLSETESLRSIQACPRSISERIVHKIATRNKRSSTSIRQNPYHELEAAYVAQICLTWEALNWNFTFFHRLRDSRRESDPGCPAYIAQQFQQFQVLLQRYVENEPYERGRRPEIYARMRSLAPKLLQVPEYRDSADEKKEEDCSSRISSESFLLIMEEAIRTFMNFLKADIANHCQILTSFFRRNRRGLVDPTVLLLLKKVNKKKKVKLTDLRRRKCFRKRLRLTEEEEMDILMALIDLKVVSRVLRMADLSEEQVHWCEDKMSKVKVSDGKLRRESSPLFFPAH